MSLSLRDDSESLDPGLVQSLASNFTVEQYCQVAIITVLLYDAVITMDKEVEFFWGKTKWSSVRVIYFANRFVGIFGVISFLYPTSYNNTTLTICKFSDWSFDISNAITIVLIDYILTIRVLALYSKDRKLTVFLMGLLGLEVAAKLAITIFGTWMQEISLVPIADDMKFYGAVNSPPFALVVIDWTIPLAYGSLLMVLASYSAAEYWRLSSGLKGFELVKVVIVDQVLYFLLAISCGVFSIINHQVVINNVIFASVLRYAGNPAFLCILGSRLVFNLKEAGKRGLNEGTNHLSGSACSMEFEEPIGTQDSSIVSA